MITDKAEIKRWLGIDEESENVMETFEVKMKISILNGGNNTIEDVMREMHRIIDEQMAKLLQSEAAVAPARIAEAERWEQQGLFDIIGGAFSARDFNIPTSGDAPED